MRITYVVHQFFPRHFTGSERVVLNLAKQMQRMGHHVDVLTYGVGDDAADFPERTGGILWREYVFEGVPVTAVLHAVPPRSFGTNVERDVQLESALAQLLPRFRADVFHIVHPLTVSSAVYVAREMGVPSVMTFTDFWIMCPRIHLLTPGSERCSGPADGSRCTNGECLGPEQRAFVEERTRRAHELIERVDQLVAPSRFVISMLQGNGYADRDIALVRHGVDYRVVRSRERRRSPGDPVTFGFIGTVLPTKGVLDLARAWRGMDAENARLKVYGPFDPPDEYKERVRREFARCRHVDLLGRYEYDDVAAILADIDVVVIPSTMFETSSLVMALAQAHGIPVITQNVGAPGELVRDGINGRLVTPGDVDALAQAMRELADDPERLEGMRAAAALPPRIEEEAFAYERIFYRLVRERADAV